MRHNVRVFTNLQEVANAFAADFCQSVASADSGSSRITVALSGGSTPQALFKTWASDYAEAIDWSRIHFFWGDERCVPPHDPQSNYGVAHELFLKKIRIDASNIHRIRGEAPPEQERTRYAQEIAQWVPTDENHVPQFDWMLLGMGDDGHTASIFPDQLELMTSDQVCEVARHPTTGQRRITLTGPVLKGANQITFLIAGANKADVLGAILRRTPGSEKYPASHLVTEKTTFYIDQQAASRLERP